MHCLQKKKIKKKKKKEPAPLRASAREGGKRGRGELLSCGGAYKDIAASTTQELLKVSESVIGARPSRPVSDAIEGERKKNRKTADESSTLHLPPFLPSLPPSNS